MKRHVKKHEYTSIWYTADDGKVFNSEKACREYEADPHHKICAKVNKFLLRVIAKCHFVSPFCYSEDYEEHVLIFKPRTHNDIEALNQYLNLKNNNLKEKEYVDDSVIDKLVIVEPGYIITTVKSVDDYIKAFTDNIKELIDDEETDSDYDEEEEKVIRKLDF